MDDRNPLAATAVNKHKSLLGGSSEEMPRRCGASGAAERAQQTQTCLGIGERV
jgi:hypothetical protein